MQSFGAMRFGSLFTTGTARAQTAAAMIPRAGLLLALSAAFAFVACEPGGDGTENTSQDVEEVDEDCRGCLVDLAECASTAKTEQQFVECRDLFATCQDGASLAADECGSPSARLACGLCQDRYAECNGETCDAEFGTCRSLLIRGPAAASCEPRQEEAPQATCEDCQRELAACASSDEASVCQNGFAQCRDVSGIEGCSNPTDAQACELCDAQADTCGAQADEATCAEQRAQCVSQLASSPEACPLDSTGSGEGGATGEGGSSGTGEGAGSGEGGSSGSGDTTSSGGACTFDGCAPIEAPSAECNACTAEVCGADAFCCEGFWDETCVGLAQASDSCGCAAANACAHDVCETGVALEDGCNDCSTQVCAQDAFCCTTEWDVTCTELAATTCGCVI